MDRIQHPKLDQRAVPTGDSDNFEMLVHPADPDLYHSPQQKFRPLRNRAALFLLGDTSLRREGLSSLHLEDINLEERWVLAMEKGRKERYADLGPTAAKALWRYRYMAARDILHPATEALWVDAQGEPMHPQWVNQMLKRLCKRT
jgi:site-specific recombinase XerD